jgi:Arc/MetJ-type ribon-helix-helix transcriptional regulator
MVPITVKLEDRSLAELDRFIQLGAAGNRTDAIRAALASWLKTQRDAELVEQYRRGYAEHPEDEDPDLRPWHAQPVVVNDEHGPAWEFDE